MVARAVPFVGNEHAELDTIEWLAHGFVDHLLKPPVPALFLIA